MSINNRITDIDTYKITHTYPNIKGISEIHVFFTPLNPAPKTVAKFAEICQNINRSNVNNPNFTKIKDCHLCLHYREKGDIRVMQSSRYITSDNMDDIIKECYAEAELIQKGFNEAYEKGEIDEKVNVIREKIEAVASNVGVPKTDNESQRYPKKYFEFHIRLGRKNENTIIHITNEEIEELKQLSESFTNEFKTPVPLSFNQTNEHQRYLNVRFENIGSEQAKFNVNKIVKAIDQSKNFKWIKTISEYVWFDSYRELVGGWIDF